MKNVIYVLLLLPLGLFSQEKETEKDQKTDEPAKIKLEEKQILRKGNDLFKQKRFVDAEVKYKKALIKNPHYETAGYNLGNAVYEQNRYKEALPQYELVAKSSRDSETKDKSLHNIGNVMMKQKQYDKAVAAYKSSMLLDPTDEETRYNLALAQKLLKDQQQNNKNKDQNKDQNKDKNKDKNEDQNKDQNSENKDQKDDQGDKDKKEKDQNKGDNKNDQNDDKSDGDKKKKNQQPQPNQLSQQQIQQLLEAMNNEENKTQKKVNAKKARGKKVKQEKDW